MFADRTATEILLRLTPAEAALVALALDGYGDAIDERATALADVLYPASHQIGRPRKGVLTVDEIDAVAQSNPCAMPSEDEEVPHA
jgi:hypothetical protein